MDNVKLVESWLKLALEDWKLIQSIDYKTHKGAAVYHAQQFVEKLCKAIIAALGFEPPKTHNPSWEIDNILSDAKLGRLRIKLDKDSIDLLEKISAISKTLEDEKTRPRYGVRHGDFIIPPEEYYSIDTVRLLISDSIHIAGYTYDLLLKLNYCAKLIDLCGELDAIRRKRF